MQDDETWQLGALYKNLTQIWLSGSKDKVIRDKKNEKLLSHPHWQHSKLCAVGRMQQAAADDTIALPGGDGLRWWENRHMLSSYQEMIPNVYLYLLKRLTFWNFRKGHVSLLALCVSMHNFAVID